MEKKNWSLEIKMYEINGLPIPNLLLELIKTGKRIAFTSRFQPAERAAMPAFC